MWPNTLARTCSNDVSFIVVDIRSHKLATSDLFKQQKYHEALKAAFLGTDVDMRNGALFLFFSQQKIQIFKRKSLGVLLLLH